MPTRIIQVLALLAGLASTQAPVLAAAAEEGASDRVGDASLIVLVILCLVLLGGIVLVLVRFRHFSKTQEANYRHALGQLEGELLRHMQPGATGPSGAAGAGAVVDNAAAASVVPAPSPPEAGPGNTPVAANAPENPAPDAQQQILERIRAGGLVASEDPPRPLPDGLPPAAALQLTNGKRVLVLPSGAPPHVALQCQHEADWVVLCDEAGEALAARPLGDQLSDWLFSA